MKLSSNSIAMLVFIALATAVFVLMVLRPAVDGNAMNFGVPISNDAATSTVSPDVSVDEVSTNPVPAASTVVNDEAEDTEENTSGESVNETNTEITTPEVVAPVATEEAVTPGDEGTEADTEEKTKTD